MISCREGGGRGGGKSWKRTTPLMILCLEEGKEEIWKEGEAGASKQASKDDDKENILGTQLL